MKPRRRAFERTLDPLLAAVGFLPEPGPRTAYGGERVYWRPVEDLVLYLAIVYHRFYDEAFTAELQLAQSFRYALRPADFPMRAIRRINEVLPQSMPTPPGGLRHSFSPEDAEWLASLVPAFVDGFLAEPGLLDAVRAVPYLSTVRALDIAIAHRVRAASLAAGDGPSQADSTMPSLGAPEAWVEAARTELTAWRERFWHPISEYNVLDFALDAYRMHLAGMIPD